MSERQTHQGGEEAVHTCLFSTGRRMGRQGILGQDGQMDGPFWLEKRKSRGLDIDYGSRRGDYVFCSRTPLKR